MNGSTMLTCQNVNECGGNHQCHRDAFCTDNHGSYSCSCIAGYTGNGFSCQGNRTEAV